MSTLEKKEFIAANHQFLTLQEWGLDMPYEAYVASREAAAAIVNRGLRVSLGSYWDDRDGFGAVFSLECWPGNYSSSKACYTLRRRSDGTVDWY